LAPTNETHPERGRDVATVKSDDLVDEIEQIRARLAGTVDELIDRTNPRNIVRRRVEDAKAHFVDESGSLRLENVIPVVAGSLAIIGALIVIRRIVR
jgi:uncharacterized protein (UPF0147 family)